MMVRLENDEPEERLARRPARRAWTLGALLLLLSLPVGLVPPPASAAATPSEIRWLSASDASSAVAGSSAEATPRLREVLAKARERARADGIKVAVPGPRRFRKWYRDQRALVFSKAGSRLAMDTALSRGVLPRGYRIRAYRGVSSIGLPPSLRLDAPGETPSSTLQWVIVERRRLAYYQRLCPRSKRPRSPCTETFRSPLPRPAPAKPLASIEVDIRPVEVPGSSLVGTPSYRDHLAIKLFVTRANLADVVRQFGVGFSPRSMRHRLRARLDRLERQGRLVAPRGDAPGRWIRLEKVLGGWLADKAGTFPRDGDNEVCYGPARQFFADRLRNGSGDRSTEAVVRVLHDGYRLIADRAEPRFGDLIHAVNRHAARFVMTDPDSGRWIGFSVQSGGTSPYRFWWVDEDFSDAPFAGQPDPHVRDIIDVWRRDRLGRS